MLYHDRQEAGRRLAVSLGAFTAAPDTAVLALPRGGIPVAAALARVLRLPLDVLAVRKLTAPQEPELALGAVARGGVTILNPEVLADLGLSAAQVRALAAREMERVEGWEGALRGGRPAVDPQGKTILAVDDGLATGASMRAAVLALRQAGAARVIAAIPVGSASACRELARVTDQTVCLQTPQRFQAVGEWYRNFPQLTDAEARQWLAAACSAPAPAA